MKLFINVVVMLAILCGTSIPSSFATTCQQVLTYNGPGNSDDTAQKTIVDIHGNIYVTGSSVGEMTGSDFLTIKYSSAGVKLWEARYNGPLVNGSDAAIAMALDANGNVYVTGRSQGADERWGYATVKYSPDGIEQWVSRYDGNANFPSAIAVDGDGNVYVTGTAAGGGAIFGDGSYDIVTIKYGSDGSELWRKVVGDWEWIFYTYYRYGFYIYTAGGDDFSTAITVDANGNVYITGTVGGGTHGRVRTRDFATIKYNSNGNLQWVAIYNGPGNFEDVAEAMTLDSNGNVYVTGRSTGAGTNFDYATIKYNPEGIQQWVARFNTPNSYADIAVAINVDANGSVSVTGYSLNLTGYGDYSPGTWDWDTSNITTIKYNTDGVEQWVTNYDGPLSKGDVATAMTLNQSGDVYIAGYSQGEFGYDYVTIKYNNEGREEWVGRYNGDGSGDDKANSIAIDPAGTVYVTGGSFGGTSSMDYVTVKYSPAVIVPIDIKPESSPNIINPDANGVIPVAILGTSEFDATTIDPLSVMFGPGKATEVHEKGHYEDINVDGTMDLLFHFNTREIGIHPGDESLSLTGRTFNGLCIQGSDAIVAVKGKE